MNSVSFNDKRKSNRKPCPGVNVTYSLEDRILKDPINDVSETGLFISTNKPHSVGNKVTLSFMSFHKKGPILMEGSVVRSTNQGFGIEFFNKTDVQRTALNTFINGYLT